MVSGSVFVSDIGYFVTLSVLALFLTTRRLAER
jgi:ABC-2 type transport system permease protein